MERTHKVETKFSTTEITTLHDQDDTFNFTFPINFRIVSVGDCVEIVSTDDDVFGGNVTAVSNGDGCKIGCKFPFSHFHVART